MRNDDWAREIAQQTFIRAYTRLDTWHGESLGGWLSSIAVRLCLNYLDRMRRHRMNQIDDRTREVEDQQYSDEHE